MAEVPEYYDLDAVEGEDLEFEVLEQSASLKMAQDAEAHTMAEEGPELPVEIDQEPQPEMEEKELEVGAPENVHLHVKPTSTSKEEIPKESERDLPSETEPGMPQKAKSETLREMGGAVFKDLEVLMDDEEPDLEPPEEAKFDVTEDVLTESDEESDQWLTEETESGVSEASVSESRLELIQQTIRNVLEDSYKKQYDLRKQAKPEFPSGKPRKSVEEGDLQPLKMTIPEEAQIKLPEEKVPEPLEETVSEFPEEKSRKSIEETGLEPSGKTKPEVEETLQESTVKKVLNPLEDTQPSDRKDKQRKSTEGTGLAPRQKTKSEVQEKTQTEETKEKDLELTDKAQLPLIIVSHTEFSTDDGPKPVKFIYSPDKDKLEHSDYETRKWSLKETKKAKRESTVGSLTISEIDSVRVSYEFSKDFKGLFEVTDIDDLYSYLSDSQRDSRESSSEKVVDLSPELKQVHKDEETQPKGSTELQFEYLKWSPEKVAEWISELGFPQYKECFTTNFICGRKLIHVNCSNLPQMGITDFEDMKAISRHIRVLLGIEEPLFSRSITLPYRENIGLFLERKGHTGVKSDSLTFSEFVQEAGLQDYAPNNHP